MVDIPTLNKSVNEFRSVIKANNDERKKIEKKQLEKDERQIKKIENKFRKTMLAFGYELSKE